MGLAVIQTEEHSDHEESKSPFEFNNTGKSFFLPQNTFQTEFPDSRKIATGKKKKKM